MIEIWHVDAATEFELKNPGWVALKFSTWFLLICATVVEAFAIIFLIMYLIK